jgi:acetyltransferase-like isoleucine patch superfamily enzyme
MSGVEIGDGSIVAAGTVVTKNIPPCEIHAGIPNKKIRDRFDDDDKSKHLAFLKLPAKAGEFCGARY